ncbi:MAG: histidine phosphatase family protein [Candidatus Staskawiczbacteria bacterium]|nr:histidine phosphatase family protein [Candidatus Staskawiczbacteria bacterium]
MARRFLGRVILLRHGQSECTNVYPDITDEGMETITKSANSIKPLLGNNPNVVIITSPMARAKGSADIIAKTIGYSGIIKEAPAIRIESISKIRKIFFEYFARMVKCLLKNGKVPLNLICVSHLETLYHFVDQLPELDYKNNPLDHGEIIEVSVFDIGIDNTRVVEIEVTFRKKTIGRTKRILFDYEEMIIR